MMTLHDLPDVGFADPRAARTVVRRMKMRRALMEARGSIERLIDNIDKGIQADRDTSSARFHEAIALAAEDIDGVERRAPIDLVESKDVREKELLDGVNVVLEFLDLAAAEIGHGLFSSNGRPTSDAPSGAGQSLCQPSEKTPPESDAGVAA